MRSATELPDALSRALRRRWILVGVGNELRGDDALGPRLARELAQSGLPALECGPAPENLTGAILGAEPEVLILADAADLGAEPGSVVVLAPGEIDGGSPTTHDPGLPLLLDYLLARRRMDVLILAVQPARLETGSDPSPAVLATIGRLAHAIRQAASS